MTRASTTPRHGEASSRTLVRLWLWLLIPLTALLLVPSVLLHVSGHPIARPWRLPQWLGAWLILNGLGLGGWCVWLFYTEGHGTPFPLDPPRYVVVSGPYRFVRNPMLLGAYVILAGETIVFRSSALLWYLGMLVLIGNLVVRYWEEPDLARRFGPCYRQHQKLVPRWIPSMPAAKTP